MQAASCSNIQFLTNKGKSMNRYLGWQFSRQSVRDEWIAWKGNEKMYHKDLIELKDKIHLKEKGYRRTHL
jgi:hypothetical protein